MTNETKLCLAKKKKKTFTITEGRQDEKAGGAEIQERGTSPKSSP